MFCRECLSTLMMGFRVGISKEQSENKVDARRHCLYALS